jgi:hypothetical protein
MITISLMIILAAGFAIDDPAPPTDPSKTTEVKASDESTKSPDQKPAKKMLKKKSDPPADKTEEKPKPASADEAPMPDSDRPIPQPDQPMSEAETDEKLDQDLGKDLEASKNEASDPLTKLTEEMRKSEELLAKLEGGDESVGVQEQIVKDLERLLKQAQNPPPGGSSQNNSKKKKQQQQQQQQMSMQQQQKRSQQRNEQARNSTDRVGPPRASRAQTSPQPEERDVWGHLSEMMRGEMSQYAKENFLAKYRDMIERYYTDIARQSQRGVRP